MAQASRLRGWGTGLLAAAVVLLLLGAGLVVSTTGPAPGVVAAPEVPVSVPTGAPAPPPVVVDREPGLEPPSGTAGQQVEGPVPPTGAPVTLDIPAIGVAAEPLLGLGLNADDTVEVPTDYARAGWFDRGPAPGEVGSAVILGHVDSSRGPAVFFRLRELRPGDRVEVGLADGSTGLFAVTAVETYPKEQFPARRVYASMGSRDLQLVTCGGEFDRVTGHYLANVVVYTSMVGTLPV